MRIYLTGFMGCGKTYWGKIWAEENNFLFYDIDELIEQAEGTTIETIFDKKGESYFRKMESALLRTTLDLDNCIISCGGGTPCYDDNMDWMNNHGITIYLESSVKELLNNMLGEPHKRPLIKNIDQSELLNYVEKKLSERIPFYKKASITETVNSLNKNSLDKLINHHQTFQ